MSTMQTAKTNEKSTLLQDGWQKIMDTKPVQGQPTKKHPKKNNLEDLKSVELEEEKVQKFRWGKAYMEQQRRELERMFPPFSSAEYQARQRELLKKREIELLKIEEQKSKFAIEIDKKLLHRDTSEGVRARKIRQQLVHDQLAASKKEQAIAVALAKEERYVRGQAKREAEEAKRDREKEKMAANHRAINGDRLKEMREKELREKADLQSHLDRRLAEEQGYRLYLEECKLKAHRTREENKRLVNLNTSLALEKLALLERQQSLKHAANLTRAEKIAVRKKFLPPLMNEDHESAEELSWKRVNVLPPISNVAEDASAAGRAMGRGFNAAFSEEGSSYSCANTGQPLPRISRFSRFF